jgi:hypothetical protein
VTVVAGSVCVTMTVVGTTSPFGSVVDVSDVIVVGGGVMMVVSSGGGVTSGGSVVQEVVKRVSVGLDSVTGMVIVTGTEVVCTPPEATSGRWCGNSEELSRTRTWDSGCGSDYCR